MRAGFGTSTGTNSSEAAPTRKPSGSADWPSSQARWAAREEKASEVDGMVSIYHARRRAGAGRAGAGTRPRATA